MEHSLLYIRISDGIIIGKETIIEEEAWFEFIDNLINKRLNEATLYNFKKNHSKTFNLKSYIPYSIDYVNVEDRNYYIFKIYMKEENEILCL